MSNPGGRVTFVGAVHEAVPALRALLDRGVEIAEVVTLPAERSASTSGFVDLEPLAREYGIVVRRCANINSVDSVRHVQRLRPDLMVVTGWTRLLSAELLGIPPRGVIGFHASLLPRYRGRAPVNWAVLRGETVTGNTMMYLDAGTDTGDIVDQQTVPITLDDTCATVYARVGEAGAEMLGRHLPALLDGTAPRRPQGPADGPPLPKRTPEMGITDWNRPARSVHDWIRALTAPYPGAFTFIAGRKLMLWTSALDGSCPGRRPGEVLGHDKDGIQVATADGVIVVASVSDAGRAPEPASAWASRNGLRAGDAFDHVAVGTAAWALGLAPRPADDGAVLPMSGNRVAVIAAHPDDELLGAGGTLARHVRDGDDVHGIIVADGAGSRYPAELVAGLEKQANRAAEVIGLTTLRFLSLPDQRLDTVPLIELTQKLEGVLDE
ncbi:MAG: formyltransferase family protein, partial [Trebonia sp.]